MTDTDRIDWLDNMLTVEVYRSPIHGLWIVSIPEHVRIHKMTIRDAIDEAARIQERRDHHE